MVIGHQDCGAVISTMKGIEIHGDINGSINIARKVTSNTGFDLMLVVSRLGVLTMPKRLRLWNKQGTIPNFSSAEKESASL